MLFPELEGSVLELPSVAVDEEPVSDARGKALTMLRCNLQGPHKLAHLICLHISSVCLLRYVATVYGQHKQLLDGQAQTDVETFLQSDPELPAFAKVYTPDTLCIDQ